MLRVAGALATVAIGVAALGARGSLQEATADFSAGLDPTRLGEPYAALMAPPRHLVGPAWLGPCPALFLGAKERPQGGDVEAGPAGVHHGVEDRLHLATEVEQQVAAVLHLVDRVAVAEVAPLLLPPP